MRYEWLTTARAREAERAADECYQFYDEGNGRWNWRSFAEKYNTIIIPSFELISAKLLVYDLGGGNVFRVVGTPKPITERKRDYALAHEFGHILLNSGDSDLSKEEREDQAHYFAECLVGYNYDDSMESELDKEYDEYKVKQVMRMMGREGVFPKEVGLNEVDGWAHNRDYETLENLFRRQLRI